MKKKIELEKLTFIKVSYLEEKKFIVFQNEEGELRAVEADIVKVDGFKFGDVLKAEVLHKGCSGREILRVYMD